ncbi:MAG: hypothetical protein ACRC11_08135 [Xenococcaceae cyanobacterium]
MDEIKITKEDLYLAIICSLPIDEDCSFSLWSREIISEAIENVEVNLCFDSTVGRNYLAEIKVLIFEETAKRTMFKIIDLDREKE